MKTTTRYMGFDVGLSFVPAEGGGGLPIRMSQRVETVAGYKMRSHSRRAETTALPQTKTEPVKWSEWLACTHSPLICRKRSKAVVEPSNTAYLHSANLSAVVF